MKPAKSEKVLRKEVFYPYPPEVVWAALTNGEAMAQWLMPNNFEAVVGRKFEFRVDPAPFYEGRVECEILELDAPSRMVWSWATCRKSGKPPLPPMRLEWTLMPRDGGTLLCLRQTGLEGQPFLFNWMMSMGWGTMLKRWLPKVLAAFERDGGKLVYRRLGRPPNRGHHGTRTIPAGYFK